MSTKNTALAETLNAFVDDRDLPRLRDLLLEGATSPPAVTADADYFDRLRRKVREAGPR